MDKIFFKAINIKKQELTLQNSLYRIAKKIKNRNTGCSYNCDKTRIPRSALNLISNERKKLLLHSSACGVNLLPNPARLKMLGIRLISRSQRA